MWMTPFVFAAFAVAAESRVVGTVALGVTLVLLPVAVYSDLIRGGAGTRGGVAKTVLVVSLFVSGVLVFADDETLAGAGAAATTVLLFATGFVEGRLRAVGWAWMLVIALLRATPSGSSIGILSIAPTSTKRSGSSRSW
jgi:hypothetical protein